MTILTRLKLALYVLRASDEMSINLYRSELGDQDRLSGVIVVNDGSTSKVSEALRGVALIVETWKLGDGSAVADV